jgi:hypothetical protein
MKQKKARRIAPLACRRRSELVLPAAAFALPMPPEFRVGNGGQGAEPLLPLLFGRGRLCAFRRAAILGFPKKPLNANDDGTDGNEHNQGQPDGPRRLDADGTKDRCSRQAESVEPEAVPGRVALRHGAAAGEARERSPRRPLHSPGAVGATHGSSPRRPAAALFPAGSPPTVT